MTPFPRKDRRISLGKRVLKTNRVPIYCLSSCRMPEDNRKMIECVTCKRWYHCSCVSLDADDSYENMDWNCFDCDALLNTE